MRRLNLPSLWQVFLILLGATLIGSAGNFLAPMNEDRLKHRLTKNKPLENAPPQIVIASTALGGLRGILINYLSFKATMMRDKGKHYEIIQLYDWICKMEPKIHQVWNFTSWEMAYNISVTFPDAKERWRWIYKGIEQIRDYGLVYNKNIPQLYFTLSYTFLDKMGRDSMDEHMFSYQKELLKLMEPTLGPGQKIEELAKAPNTRRKLLQQKGIKEYIALFEKENIDIFALFFKLYKLTPGEQKELTPEQTKKRHKILQLLNGKQHLKQSQQLQVFLRSYRLRTEFKMEPKKMLAIEKKYAPLDWRLATAHALYWAEQGAAVYERNPDIKGDEDHYRNMDRLRDNALSQLFEEGHVLGKGPRGLICIPNFALIEVLHQQYLDDKKRWKEDKMRTSHDEFLRNVVKLCYINGKFKKAHKYYKILRQKFSNALYKKRMEKFVVDEMFNDVKGVGRSVILEQYISAVIVQAFDALLSSDRVGAAGADLTHRALGLFGFSKQIYKEYVRRHGDLEGINQNQQPRTYKYFVKNASDVILYRMIRYLGPKKAALYWKELTSKFSLLKVTGWQLEQKESSDKKDK